MIKCAFEVPIAHLTEVEEYQDFYFCIATSLVKYPEMLQYYKTKAKGDKLLMLDNGAYEAHAKGTPSKILTPKELLELVLEVHPHVVWSPDKLFDRQVTEDLSEEFYDLWHKYVIRKGIYDIQLGFIPQGRTADDIIASLTKYGYRYSWIGLSFLNDRASVLRLLGRRILAYPNIHMLGLQDVEEMLLWPRYIRYVDTSKPIKAAFLGKMLTKLQRGEGLLLPTDIVKDRSLLYANLISFRKACAL